MLGRIISIEGPDGSGKEAQSKLLIKRLSENNFDVRFYDFPRYDNFFGEMAGKMLAGAYGPIENINPSIAATLYAFDRWQAADGIRADVTEGKIVVTNRFTLSNIAHQTARVDTAKRADFIRFVLELENEVLHIPKPDLYIYLNVPTEISQRLIAKKLQRKYLDTQSDLLESDVNHQLEAARMYGELSHEMPNTVRVDCSDEEGNLKSIDEIHQLVWGKTTEHLKSNLEGQRRRKES